MSDTLTDLHLSENAFLEKLKYASSRTTTPSGVDRRARRDGGIQKYLISFHLGRGSEDTEFFSFGRCLTNTKDILP